MFILVALLVLGVLIFVHELGHFIVAKLSGMPVDEFSLGFGPAIVSKQWGETQYSLRILPLGGYNKIAGMEPNDDRPNGFNHKPLAARMGVILAGSLSNLVFAVLIFVIMFSVIGVPTASNANLIGDILPKSPAESAGLQPGDRIVMIDGRQTSTWDDVASSIHGKGARPVTLLIERNERDFSLAITPKYDPTSKSSLIGIVPTSAWLKQGFFPAVQSGLQESYGWSVQIVQSLGQLFTGRVQMQDLSGPVGIVKTLGDTAREGLRYLLLLTGVLGINLAIVNLLPIPALDGSRLVFLLLEGVRGKPINPEKENIIHLVGFAVLMCLVLMITYNDIIRLFSGG
jgi:regulator of sigma E protease